MKKSVQACPINPNKVDENAARMNAVFTFFFVIIGIGYPIAWVLIAIDFAVRSINPRKSLISKLSKIVLNKLKIKPKEINQAPKLFAARMGLAMSLLLILFELLQFRVGQTAVLLLFISAIILEAGLNYCLGCKIYSILINLKIIKIKK